MLLASRRAPCHVQTPAVRGNPEKCRGGDSQTLQSDTVCAFITCREHFMLAHACTQTHAYVDPHMHTRARTCAWPCTHVLTRAHACTIHCTRERAHTCTRTCAHTCTYHTRTRTYVHMRAPTHAHMHANPCAHTCAHTCTYHTCTRTCVHTRAYLHLSALPSAPILQFPPQVPGSTCSSEHTA